MPRVRPALARPLHKSYVLVSVGTTKFPELIAEVATPKFVQTLKDLGYNGLHIQYGNTFEHWTNIWLLLGTGPAPVIENDDDDFDLQIFALKPSLDLEFTNASLVIGHAGKNWGLESLNWATPGVGTLFEALEKERDVIAVPNESLMNNHQREIADILVSSFNLSLYLLTLS